MDDLLPMQMSESREELKSEGNGLVCGNGLVMYQGALLQKQFVTLVALEPLESGQCQRSAYFDLENLRLRKCGI